MSTARELRERAEVVAYTLREDGDTEAADVIDALLVSLAQPGEGALTEEQLVEGFTKTALASLNYGDWFDAGARFAERAHGITSTPTGDSNG